MSHVQEIFSTDRYLMSDDVLQNQGERAKGLQVPIPSAQRKDIGALLRRLTALNRRLQMIGLRRERLHDTGT
jgi:hypothetical protein